MLDWSKIDLVLLDMDGTLLDLHFDNYFWQQHLPQYLAQRHQWSLAQAADWLDQQCRLQQGSLNWYCLDFWSRELDLDIVTLKHQIAERIRYRPSAEQFLAELRGAAKPVWLLTNAHPASLALKHQHTGLGQYFDQQISSHQFGLAKEQAGFWDLLQQNYPLDLSRCLLIDDNEQVLSCAQQAGVAQCWSIAQPDLLQPMRESPAAFTRLLSFEQLLPIQ